MSTRMLLACGASILCLSATQAQAEIELGLATALTGQIAALGQQSRRGAEAAIEDINEKGGVLGEELVLTAGDDACDPKQAVALANQFVSDGVEIVIGHLCSSAAIAAADVYAEEGTVMLTASATSPALTAKAYDTIFRACGRDDQQATLAAELILKQFPDKRIAIVHDKGAYGQGLAMEMEKALANAGVTPAYTGSIAAGERDYSALITRLKADNVDVLYYGGYHSELGLIARQAAQQGYDLQLIAADGLATDEYWAIAGEAGEGTLFTFSPDPKRNPEITSILEELRAEGPEPDNFTLYHYAAVQILAQAIEEAGSADPEAVAEALHSGTFDTIVGTMQFDERGDLTKPDYVFYEWKDGSYDYAAQ
ncbi:branched-chain amino acid ABC transporter substrate-binding protein [Rhodospirillaceae bacterium SYSU D60014]|uniref:branched-chain amino acid ABC transporter substrate-binding protein n=1 Tax=Virgifigura deserti TaxID=2268457 RepID=UPI000E673183